MTTYNLALLPGDGIGPEVINEALKTAAAVSRHFGFTINRRTFPFGAAYYLKHGEILPKTALDELGACQALLAGAVGDPRVKPGILEQELLLTLRFHFDQYLNIRPAKNFPNVPLPVPLSEGRNLDMLVVRENTEDLYMAMGGQGEGRFETALSAKRGQYDLEGLVKLSTTPAQAAAFSLALMTAPAVARITRKAFGFAQRRGETKVHVATKANAVPHLYGFWNEQVAKTAEAEFPDMKYEFVNVDALCYLLPRNPEQYHVMLCPNLFGDIVSDLVSALAGGLGLAASGNIGDSLSMFEPVHGSAPDIAGTNRANPLAAILSLGLLFAHLGEKEAAGAVNQAVYDYLANCRPEERPVELGGQAGTSQVGDQVAAMV